MSHIPPEERPDLISARTRSAKHFSSSLLANEFSPHAYADGVVLTATEESATTVNGRPAADPKTRAEAMKDDAEGWTKAEETELQNHDKNGSFEVIDLSLIHI